MVPLHIPLIVAATAYLAHVSAIMVPTGKVGGITPPKMSPVMQYLTPRAQYQAPAPVWERVDEGDNPYSPPVYKYILWEYVQKYGHHTLIARPEDYYMPQQSRIQPVTHFYKSKGDNSYGKGAHTSNSKNKMYYSTLQQL